MALKFRRGTTAQQSGSLAFGEPFVNTTLGTLIVGGTDGDIVLSAGGTGSTGNFGPISGSGLDITGNANIAGNLTLGGQLTIGDATSDTVNVVASLSSSLIPQTANAFDLGSATNFWRDLYISTGSIKFVGAAGTVVGTLSNAANGMILDSGIVANGNSSFGTSSAAITSVTGSLRVSGSVVVTGSLIVSGSDIEFIRDWQPVGTESHFLRLAPFTSSTGRYYDGIGIGVEHWDDGSGTYEHAIQIHSFDNHDSVNYGAELNVGPYRTHMRVIPSGSVGTLSNISVQELTNGKTQALVYADFVQIGAFAGESIIIGNSGSVVEISGSVRGNITGSIAATNGVVSGSSQVIGILSSLNTYTGSNDTTNTTQNSRLDQLSTASGSAITRLSALEVETANLEAFTSSINTTIKTKLDTDGVISGSSQITLSSTTGFSAYSTSVDSRIATEKGRVDAILLSADADKDSFAEIVSLINSVDTTNDNAFASFYTASVGRLNNLESTSASVNISVSNLNSTTASLNTSVSNLNTFSGSALTRLSALEVETANLEAFTSSINTTIKTRLNAETVVSGSSQISHDSTTGYSANRHIDHTAVTITAGSGLSGGGDISATRTLSIATGGVTDAMLAGSISNGKLTNSTISGIALGSNLAALTIGTGLSGTSYNGSTGVTIANTGVTSNVAGSGISLSGGTGAVTITNSGVRSIAAGTGVAVSATTGDNCSISIGQSVATSANVQFNSLGIGMAASATAGRIDATNDIVAFSSSDIRFKENIKPIENALDKIRKISGNTYDWKAENKAEHGYEGNDVGVIAQEIEAVLPQLVQTRENGYKAVKYDKLVALLIEGIKDQQLQIEQLRIDLNNCRNKGL
jgi:hypothetical protein